MGKQIKNLDDAKELLKKVKKKPEPENFDWLNARQFDANKKINRPDPIITIQDKTILTMGNYITVSGKPKAGKSAFISGLVAASLTGANVLGWNVKLPENRNNIVHLDTEQGEWEFYHNIQMMQKLAAIETMPTVFHSFRLRGIKAEQIRDAVTHLANLPNTGLLIIDGLLDTIIDFNDINECRMITDLLRNITEKQNIGIICIIHQGKAHNYSIGHLGSFADRYSQSVLEVVRDEDHGLSILKPVYLRSASKFEPVHIAYNVNEDIWKFDPGTPEHQKSTGKKIDDEDLPDFIDALFQDAVYVIYTEVENRAKKFFKIRKNQVAAIVKRCFELELIKKEGNNYYRVTPF